MDMNWNFMSSSVCENITVDRFSCSFACHIKEQRRKDMSLAEDQCVSVGVCVIVGVRVTAGVGKGKKDT